MKPNEIAEALDFLRELAANNHKPWMDENRDRYRLHRGRFERWVEHLADRISEFDPLGGGAEGQGVYLPHEPRYPLLGRQIAL